MRGKTRCNASITRQTKQEVPGCRCISVMKSIQNSQMSLHEAVLVGGIVIMGFCCVIVTWFRYILTKIYIVHN